MGKDLNGNQLEKGFTQRKDGLYIARFTTKEGTKILKANKDLETLKQQVENLLQEPGLYIIDGKKISLNDWFIKWYQEKCIDTFRFAEHTTEYNRKRIQSMFLDRIGRKPLSSIKDQDIQKIINQYLSGEILNSREKPYTKKYVADTFHVFKGCFESAVNQQILKYNPCLDIVVNQKERHDKTISITESEEGDEKTWLTPGQVRIFLESIEDSWYYEMFYFMIYTGLRISEVGGLTWNDIDFKNKEIHVRKAYKCYYLKGVKRCGFTILKTTNGKRVIPMQDNLIQILKNQKKKTMERKKELGKRWRAESGYESCVFFTSFGTPVDRYSAEGNLNSAVKTANELEAFRAMREERYPEELPHLSPHSLRHTFCSICFSSGLKPEITRRLMGHAHLSTTIEIYTHFSNADLHKEIAKFHIGDQGMETANLMYKSYM